MGAADRKWAASRLGSYVLSYSGRRALPRVRLAAGVRQSLNLPAKGGGRFARTREPGGGSDPHPTASRSTSPFQGEVKRVCGSVRRGRSAFSPVLEARRLLGEERAYSLGAIRRPEG